RTCGSSSIVIASPQPKRCGLIEASGCTPYLERSRYLRSRNAAASLKPCRKTLASCRCFSSPQPKRCGLIEACAPREGFTPVTHLRSRNAAASLKQQRLLQEDIDAVPSLRSRNAPASLKHRGGQLRCADLIDLRSRTAAASLKLPHLCDFIGDLDISAAETLRPH